MAEQLRPRSDDAFLLSYTADELRTVSEFFTNWTPFLSRGLCQSCVHTISDRIRSLDHEAGRGAVSVKQTEEVVALRSENTDLNGYWDQGNCDTHSIGSWEDSADINDSADRHSLGSLKEESYGSPEPVSEASKQSNPSGVLMIEKLSTPALVGSRGVKMSWADMAQEDELETREESGSSLQLDNVSGLSWEGASEDESKPKTELSREQRERIRFSNVKRKKDFICLERINGKIVNILDGLELHTGVFSAAEQIRIVDYVETFKEMGKNGQSKEKCTGDKGQMYFQFGCCHNYATDKNDNPPEILKEETVDPIPQLLKVMIKRLVKWHVMPPNCIPDTCVVNFYEEGDCIPPRIENHDFVRPFCTVSFLSKCEILFGSNMKVSSPGEFDGPFSISLPVGSVLVLNGKGADVAKHCVPPLPAKRILLTFMRMDESKRPVGYVPDPDLQDLQPLSYESNKSKKSKMVKHRHAVKEQVVGREENAGKPRRSTERNFEHRYSGQPRHSGQPRQWHASKPRVTVDYEESADHPYRRTVKY